MAYKFNIPVGDLLNRIHAGPELRRMLADASCVIPANELYELHRSRDLPDLESRIRCTPIPQAELFDVLRSAIDNSGREAYAGARFEIGKVTVPPAYGVQTYVTMEGLNTVWVRDSFMRSLGVEGFNSGNAYVITTGTDVKYAALLLPPLVMHYAKSEYDITLRNVETLIENKEELHVMGVSGNVKLDLERLLRATKAEIAGTGPSIPVVKDGTHRAYVCYATGTPLTAIVIRGAEERPTSVPISFNDVVLCAERPSKPARYPGFHNAGMVDLDRLGIDS